MGRQSPFFDKRGFTLLEMMIATSLVSVVLLAIMSTTDNFSQSTLAFRRSVPSTIEREQFQDYFSRLTQAAWVSTQYLHLPVSWSAAAGGAPCAAGDTGPCIRRQGYTPAGTFVGGQTTFEEITATVATPTSKYIDFYRDEFSDLVSTGVYPSDPNNYLVHSLGLDQFQIGAGTNLSIGEAYLQTDYFASWRLDNQTSAPFFILSQYPSRNAFVFSSTPSARVFRFVPTDPGMQGAGNAAARTALATAIKTGLMLVYNSSDPRQYSIQYISAITLPDNTNFDITLNPVNLAGNPIGAGTPHAWYQSAGAANYSGNVTTATFTWQGNCGNVWPALQLDPSANGFYLFPSEYFSFCSNQPADGAPGDWAINGNPFRENPPAGGVDFGLISVYYSSSNPGAFPQTPPPQLIGIPLIATAFYIGPGIVPPGCSALFPVANPPPGCPSTAPLALQSVSLPGPITRTHISMLSQNLTANTAPVYFGRRLGSSKIEAFVK